MALLRSSKPRGRSAARRTKGREALIRTGVWGAVAVGVLLFVILSCVALENLFYSRNPHFTLRDVQVETIKGTVDPAFVQRKLKLQPGEDNLYALDLAELRRELLEDPIIQEADVRRVLPDQLLVTVYGRTPVAQLLRKGGLLVDASGYIMGPGRQEETLTLPIVVGVPNAGKAREGTLLNEPALQSALEFLKYRATMNRGNWLDVRFVQCNMQYEELIIYLHKNPEFLIRDNAKLVLPTRKMYDALTNAMDVIEIRSLARQPTAEINATYQRIPVAAYRQP